MAVTARMRVANGISWVETRDAAHRPAVHSPEPTKKYRVQHVNSAKAEKPSSDQNEGSDQRECGGPGNARGESGGRCEGTSRLSEEHTQVAAPNGSNAGSKQL